MPRKLLKRYRVQDLDPGMVLGKTILNEKGQVMVDQGKVMLQEGMMITRELIDRLLNWNISVVEVQVEPPASSAVQRTDADRLSREKLESDMLEWVVGADPLSMVLDQLTQGIGWLYPRDHVFVTLLEGTPFRWWVIAAAGSFRLPDVALDQKFQGAAYLGGQSVTIGELSMHKAPPVLSRADMLSMCGVPIVADGMTVGVLEVFSQRPNGFAPEDVAAFTHFSRLAAVAILSSRRQELLRQTSNERDLLYEIMGFVSATIPPEQLLSKVADSLSNYSCAQAVASFSVQRLFNLNKTTEVLVRNFTRMDMENLKEIFAERWPVSVDNEKEDQTMDRLDRQKAFSVTLSGGKSIYILPLFSRDLLQGIIVLLWEYERRIDNYRHMEDMVRIVADQTALGLERHHLYAGVKKLGLTDDLTGLSNRRMFNHLMDREINRSRRYGRPLSLVMIDIDHFKKINDTWGHQAGDMVLRELGALMRENFRRLDVPARYGGEEFAAILPETSLEEAIQFSERFRLIVENALFMNGKTRIPVTISLGIASVGNSPLSEEMDADELLHYADRALYQAKNNGRNRIAAGRGTVNSG